METQTKILAILMGSELCNVQFYSVLIIFRISRNFTKYFTRNYFYQATLTGREFSAFL